MLLWRIAREAHVDTTLEGVGGLMGTTSVGLRVPSTVVPVESNVLLNPRHPEMNQVRILRNEPFRFDPRLL